MNFYILDDQDNPVEADIVTHAIWLKANGMRYHLKDTVCGNRVSTVFLGIDHNYSESGPPILFETMIWQQDRYATWTEAKIGHKEACAWARRNGWLVRFGLWLGDNFFRV